MSHQAASKPIIESLYGDPVTREKEKEIFNIVLKSLYEDTWIIAANTVTLYNHLLFYGYVVYVCGSVCTIQSLDNSRIFIDLKLALEEKKLLRIIYKKHMDIFEKNKENLKLNHLNKILGSRNDR